MASQRNTIESSRADRCTLDLLQHSYAQSKAEAERANNELGDAMAKLQGAEARIQELTVQNAHLSNTLVTVSSEFQRKSEHVEVQAKAAADAYKQKTDALELEVLRLTECNTMLAAGKILAEQGGHRAMLQSLPESSNKPSDDGDLSRFMSASMDMTKDTILATEHDDEANRGETGDANGRPTGVQQRRRHHNHLRKEQMQDPGKGEEDEDNPPGLLQQQNDGEQARDQLNASENGRPSPGVARDEAVHVRQFEQKLETMEGQIVAGVRQLEQRLETMESQIVAEARRQRAPDGTGPDVPVQQSSSLQAQHTEQLTMRVEDAVQAGGLRDDVAGEEEDFITRFKWGREAGCVVIGTLAGAYVGGQSLEAEGHRHPSKEGLYVFAVHDGSGDTKLVGANMSSLEPETASLRSDHHRVAKGLVDVSRGSAVVDAYDSAAKAMHGQTHRVMRLGFRQKRASEGASADCAAGSSLAESQRRQIGDLEAKNQMLALLGALVVVLDLSPDGMCALVRVRGPCALS